MSNFNVKCTESVYNISNNGGRGRKHKLADEWTTGTIVIDKQEHPFSPTARCDPQKYFLKRILPNSSGSVLENKN